MVRKSKGRQKIEMTKMSKESNLLVTFSKRRSGLFKKAYELHTLCGAEIGIIVFSPGKKVFSYGHPCLYSLIDRFLAGKAAAAPCSGSQQLVEAHRSASIRELNSQLTEIMNTLEMERKRGDELTRMRKASQGRCWWEAPPSQLGLPELEQLTAAVEELKKNVAKQAEKLMDEATNATSFLSAATPSSSSAGPTPPAKVPTALDLTMAPHGFSLGYGGRGFY